ncbi:MAG: hypothetical protein ACRYF7_20085, partial [Janthinobacterium lividum]
HSALNDFGGILGLLLHGSIFSKNGASTKPGAVQVLGNVCDPESVLLFTRSAALLKRAAVKVFFFPALG